MRMSHQHHPDQWACHINTTLIFEHVTSTPPWWPLATFCLSMPLIKYLVVLIANQFTTFVMTYFFRLMAVLGHPPKRQSNPDDIFTALFQPPIHREPPHGNNKGDSNQAPSSFFVVLCVHGNNKAYLERGKGWVGWTWTARRSALTCKHWRGHHTVRTKLQALVYDILPWRKVPESDARSVRQNFCTSLIAVSAAVRSSHKDSVQKAGVETRSKR